MRKITEEERQEALDIFLEKYPELKLDKQFMIFMNSAFNIGYDYGHIFRKYNKISKVLIFMYVWTVRIVIGILFGIIIGYFDAPLWASILTGLIGSAFCTSDITTVQEYIKRYEKDVK